MEKIKMIIQAANNEDQERKIAAIACIKYRLPSIDSYVVEIEASRLYCLKNMDGVQTVHATSVISL